ncbi:MAG: tetratricopeptide repeat protein [Acidobacteriota bacterium]
MASRKPIRRLLVALALLALPVGAATAGDVAPETLLARAGRALEAGDLVAAEDAFTQARDADPEKALPWLGLADVAERRGDALGALGHARRAETLAPELPEAALRVARLQIRVGAAAEALGSLERLRGLAPENPAGYLLAALVLRDVERLDQGVEVLRLALERGVDPPAIHEQLGLLELAAGRGDAAWAVASKALERFPGQGGLALVAGLALAADPERRGQAIPWLEKALDLGIPEEGRARLELGTLLLEVTPGCDDRALDHLRAAREQLPTLPEAHYRLGTALRTCGDAEGAREALTRFQELSRASDAADHGSKAYGTRLNEAQGLAAQGRLDDAVAALDALLEEKPGDARTLILRSKVLFSAGQREAALDSAVAARESMPSRTEAHYLEGLYLSQLGRLDEATAALERAIAIDADLGSAHTLLGVIAADQERYGDAAEALFRALDLGADGAPLRLALARTLDALGRAEEAKVQMEAYRRLADDP